MKTANFMDDDMGRPSTTGFYVSYRESGEVHNVAIINADFFEDYIICGLENGSMIDIDPKDFIRIFRNTKKGR